MRDHRHKSMEDGFGSGVEVLSGTPLPARKRSASSLGTDPQDFKRAFNSIPRSRSVATPLQNPPDRGLDPGLRNAGPVDGDRQLILQADNSGIPCHHSSSYDSGPLGYGYCSDSDDEQHLAVPCNEVPWTLHEQPVVHLPQTGIHWSSSSLQTPCSPFSAMDPGWQLQPDPASTTLGHPPLCMPCLRATRNTYGPYHHLVHLRTPLSPYSNGSSQPAASCVVVPHPHDAVAFRQWQFAANGTWQRDAVPPETSTTFNLQLLPQMSSQGYSSQLTRPHVSVNKSYGVACSPPVVPCHSAPGIEPNSPYHPFDDPSRHDSVSTQSSGHQYVTWATPDSVPMGLPVASQAFEQLTPSLDSDGHLDHSALDKQQVLLSYTDKDDHRADVGLPPDSISTENNLSSYCSQILKSPEGFQHHLSNPGRACRFPYPMNGSGAAENQDTLVVVAEGPALDNTGPKRTKRRRFNKRARDETNRTRLRNACVACRKQRVRCCENRYDSAGPCDGCRRRGDSSSGKIIHRGPCVRTFTVSSIIMIRKGGLGLTRRWEGTKLVNVVDGTTDSAIRTIEMLQGLSKKPIVVQVRKFTPLAGDVVDREWTYEGKKKVTPLEPYCLVDIYKTADYFSRYLRDTAYEGLRHAAYTSPLVRATYCMACDHEAKLSKKLRTGSHDKRLAKELDFFRAVLELVWSLRHTTGSVWLTGEEKLGLAVPKEEGYPLKNAWTEEHEVALPRMIVAQFDSIQNERILPRLLKRVLTDLEKYLSACKDEWFSMYLAVFMLLHEISVASRDRYRWARERGQKARYGGGEYASLGLYVENLQKASYPLLAYWHYYNVDELGKVDWNRLNQTKKLKHLDPAQATFIQTSTQMMRDEAQGIPEPPACWEHDLHFVSHMYKQKWDVGYQTFNFMDE